MSRKVVDILDYTARLHATDPKSLDYVPVSAKEARMLLAAITCSPLAGRPRHAKSIDEISLLGHRLIII